MGNQRSQAGRVIASDGARKMYGKMLSCWASDLISHPPRIDWQEQATDAELAYQNHDWRRLYTGSVLDD